MSQKELGIQPIQAVAGALAMSDVCMGGILLYLATQTEVVPVLKAEPIESVLYVAIFAGLAIMAIGLSFTMKASLMKAATTAQGRAKAVLVALAITDAAGVMGLVMGLLTGFLVPAFIFIGLSGGIKVFHWPTRASLERAE